MATTNIENCYNCRWCEIIAAVTGRCKRHAPIAWSDAGSPFSENLAFIKPVWPLVEIYKYDDNKCGDFEVRVDGNSTTD